MFSKTMKTNMKNWEYKVRVLYHPNQIGIKNDDLNKQLNE